MPHHEAKAGCDCDSQGGNFMLGLFLAIGIIVAAFVLSGAIKEFKRSGQTIRVKGFAEQPITSDLAVWRGSFSVQGEELVSVYGAVKSNLAKVTAYLKEAGISEEGIEVEPVSTTTKYKMTQKGNRTNEIEGYLLTQSVKVTSDDVKLIERISRASSKLIQEGITWQSYPPQYFYTKLEDSKVELLGKAMQNATLRAEQLAEHGNGEVGNVQSVSQGVFQITPRHSTMVSDYGSYDTSTVEKSIKAVVTAHYRILD